MGLWNSKAEAKLAELIHSNNKDRPKTMEELGKTFRASAPYKGICTECKTQKYTDKRIERKARRLIAEISREIPDKKDVLVLPPTAVVAAKAKKKASVAPVVVLERDIILRELLKGADKSPKNTRAKRKPVKKTPSQPKVVGSRSGTANKKTATA